MPPKRASKKMASTDGSDSPSYATSMEQLYLKHYAEQVAASGPQSVVLLQVGGFFEMYDQADKETGKSLANVQAIAELCGSTIEFKPSHDPSKHRIFWGFPEHALPKYERILVNAGYTVRVVVQHKDASGKVADRTVDHVSSPGTFYDNPDGGMLLRKDEQIMLGIYIEPYALPEKRQKRWTIASSAFDIMTGHSTSIEADVVLIDNKPVLDAIHPFWSVHPPAELVVYWSAPPDVLPPTKDALLAMIPGTQGGMRPPVHVVVLDSKHESTAAADRLRCAFLSEVYRHDSALSINTVLGLERHHTARKSLYHLLRFVKDHNPSYLTALHTHDLWSSEQNVLLGNAALSQLAMLPPNSDCPQESLLHWLMRAVTAMGKRTLRERCLTPISDVEELDARQTRIAVLRDDAVRSRIECHLRGMYDLPRLYRRFQLGHGTTDDLLQLLRTYEKAEVLLKETTDQVFDAQDREELLDHIREVNATWNAERIRKSRSQVGGDSIAVGSCHPWNRGIHADLDTLEDRWNVLETSMVQLRARYESCIEEIGCISWTLKDDAPFTFQTTMRRAAVLTALLKRRGMPEVEAVKRGSSSTVTLDNSEIQTANSSGLKLRAEWKELVAEKWHSTWKSWCDRSIDSGVWDQMVEWIGMLDAECAFASVANAYGYVRPVYKESTEAEVAGFKVEQLRHPIIERISDVPYISHNLSLGCFAGAADDCASSSSGILLYGVNAAGKSSLGKAIGLAVLMAQCGIPVPASSMTLVPYTGLFTRILGNDNLWAGMSSFVVEMTEFRTILRSAGARTLVLGDELCAGTETASATAIVAAGVQTLAARKANFFFATHLHELAEIPEISNNPHVSFYHLTVHSNYEDGTLVYDRKLKRGCGSPMYGLEVCRGLDMDSEFLESALAFRKRLFDTEGPRPSRYNAGVVVGACSVCTSRDNLETHHIVPQAAALDGFIAPGKHKNAKENLAVLCDDCHKKHHSGLLEIQGWEATSRGKKLAVRRN